MLARFLNDCFSFDSIVIEIAAIDWILFSATVKSKWFELEFDEFLLQKHG